MKEGLSVLAGLLCIVGLIPYIRAILRKETKPAKASWMIWAILDTIILSGMLAKQAVNGQIVGSVIGTWVVVFLALKYGTPGWKTLDKICLTGAVVGILLWGIFRNPLLGIIISLGVNTIGSIPTFVSAWRDPNREDKLAWTIFWLSSVCATIAIPEWILAHVAQPATFFTLQTIMMYTLYFHKPK